ncbi:HigA family addiction module antitoxin [Desulfonatronum thiodismutans]|uniref:HigA family addiction module antitoxin n=1 Tax=Desulfonatronum thiodismutans TaxID=159290 RepID=UPI000A0376CF|nr:HigA family addiction module antitoxin [Desulfonatronum thiodismutans]
MIRRPTHPGQILREDYLAPLNLSVSHVASRLGISRSRLSALLNEQGSVSPDLALRLASALNTSPDLWLNLQRNYDLWVSENASFYGITFFFT